MAKSKQVKQLIVTGTLTTEEEQVFEALAEGASRGPRRTPKNVTKELVRMGVGSLRFDSATGMARYRGVVPAASAEVVS